MAQTLISSGWFSFELRVTVPVHELVSFTRMSLDAKRMVLNVAGWERHWMQVGANLMFKICHLHADNSQPSPKFLCFVVAAIEPRTSNLSNLSNLFILIPRTKLNKTLPPGRQALGFLMRPYRLRQFKAWTTVGNIGEFFYSSFEAHEVPRNLWGLDEMVEEVLNGMGSQTP